MLVEILLKLFICIVNIELLKTVYLKRQEFLKNAQTPNILLCKQGTALSCNMFNYQVPEKMTKICRMMKHKYHTIHLHKVLKLTSKFSNPNMSKIPMDLKSSLLLILLLIFLMTQAKH